MKTVVITGITGKSGKYFLENLIENADRFKDYYFKVSVRETSDTTLLDSTTLKYEKCYGDLKDYNYLNKLCTNIDTLLHIAGIHFSPLLVDAAISNGVKRMILVHTTGIYSKYKSASHDYINIEKQIEEKTKNKDISITILRPTMIYGSLSDHNISTFIRMVDKLRLFPVVNKAEYELQPVHASDLGKAYYQVLINTEQTSNKNYDLSGGKPIKLIDIFKTIEKYLGKKIIYISFPFWFAYSGACLLYCFSFGKKDYREKVQRLVEPRVYSHEEAKKDFGYNPMSFDIGVKEEVNEYIKVKTGDEIVS